MIFFSATTPSFVAFAQSTATRVSSSDAPADVTANDLNLPEAMAEERPVFVCVMVMALALAFDLSPLQPIRKRGESSADAKADEVQTALSVLAAGN